MVEPDGSIAQTRQRFRGNLRLFEPLGQAWQCRLIDQALVMLEPRYVRVAE